MVDLVYIVRGSFRWKFFVWRRGRKWRISPEAGEGASGSGSPASSVSDSATRSQRAKISYSKMFAARADQEDRSVRLSRAEGGGQGPINAGGEGRQEEERGTRRGERGAGMTAHSASCLLDPPPV